MGPEIKFNIPKFFFRNINENDLSAFYFNMKKQKQNENPLKKNKNETNIYFGQRSYEVIISFLDFKKPCLTQFYDQIPKLRNISM